SANAQPWFSLLQVNQFQSIGARKTLVWPVTVRRAGLWTPQFFFEFLKRSRFRSVTFSSKFQRPFPRLAGILGTVELVVDIPQMVPQRGVISTWLLDRFFQRPDRFLVSLLPIENPAQAIQIGGILGLGVDRLTDHLLGLFQIFALVGVEIAQVIANGDIIGILRVDRFKHLLPSFRVTLLNVESRKRHTRLPDNIRVGRVLFDHI